MHLSNVLTDINAQTMGKSLLELEKDNFPIYSLIGILVYNNALSSVFCSMTDAYFSSSLVPPTK